jgi:predicted transcriptional regulator
MQREVLMSQSVLEMATDLVSAQIQTGGLSPEDMQEVLQKTYASLMTLKTQEDRGSGTARTQEPVDWRKSITRHTITCLECGQTFKQLSSRHLRQHDLDGQSYREKYGIARMQPLAAKATTALRRQIVSEIKPWEKTPTYMKAQEERAATAKKAGRKKETRRR